MDNLTTKQIDWLDRESLAAKEATLGTVINTLITTVNAQAVEIAALTARVVVLEGP